MLTISPVPCRDKYDGCEDGLCRNQCSSLYVCLATTFDQGFKNDGGIGAYLGQNLSLSDWGDAEWFIRLVFDHAFTILLLTVRSKPCHLRAVVKHAQWRNTYTNVVPGRSC